MYRALADPTRRAILKLLRDGELPAGGIASQFDMSWPSVSRHLGVLEASGLVRSRRAGQSVIYALTTSVLVDIVTELADLVPKSARPRRPARPANRTAREGDQS